MALLCGIACHVIWDRVFDVKYEAAAFQVHFPVLSDGAISLDDRCLIIFGEP